MMKIVQSFILRSRFLFVIDICRIACDCAMFLTADELERYTTLNKEYQVRALIWGSTER